MKILVVDDHGLVREGLVGTLRGLRDDIVTFGAADANEAVLILEQEDIDLMLLDLMMPGTRGQVFLPVVRRRFPTVPVVVLSAHDDADTVAATIKAGASGFISKASGSEQLLEAIQQVLSGEVYVAQPMQDAVKRSASAKTRSVGGRSLAKRYGLTPAQVRVLEHLAEGNTNRQIAELLGLSEGTVKIHVSAIMKALNVNNRAEAALLVTTKRKR